MNIIQFLKGKKTYLVAFAGIAAAVAAWATDTMTSKEAIEAIMAALGISTLRAGVAKNAPLSSPPKP